LFWWWREGERFFCPLDPFGSTKGIGRDAD
jgi:hypothetical protein